MSSKSLEPEGVGPSNQTKDGEDGEDGENFFPWTSLLLASTISDFDPTDLLGQLDSIQRPRRHQVFPLSDRQVRKVLNRVFRCQTISYNQMGPRSHPTN